VRYSGGWLYQLIRRSEQSNVFQVKFFCFNKPIE
jgi:hypothetical protein